MDQRNSAVTATALVAVTALSGVIFHELRWALLPFVLASLLAYLCNPLVDRLAQRFKLRRYQSALVIFLALVALAAGAGYLALPPLLREIGQFATDIQSVLLNLMHSLVGSKTVVLFGRPMDAQQLAEAAMNGLRDWIGRPAVAVELAAMGFTSLFGGILVLVLLFYLLLTGPAIMDGLLWLAPVAHRPVIEKIWSRFGPLLWRYVLGVLIVVIYAIVAAYIGLGLVLGLQHALFLAILTGLFEMIPVIGPGASAALAGLVAIRSATGIGPVIAYAIYAIALRLSIDQLLGPLVLGSAAMLNPVVIIVGFLVGGALFGVSGVILAVPLAIAVKTSLAVIRDEGARYARKTDEGSSPA